MVFQPPPHLLYQFPVSLLFLFIVFLGYDHVLRPPEGRGRYFRVIPLVCQFVRSGGELLFRRKPAKISTMDEQREQVLTQIKLGKREKTAIVIVLVVVALLFLYVVRHILPPFIWGIVAAYVLNPLVNWISLKTKVRRGYIVMIMALALVFGLGWVIVNVTAAAISEVQDMQEHWPEILASVEKDFFGNSQPTLFGFTVTATSISDAVARQVGDVPRGALTALHWTVDLLGKLLIFFVTFFLLLLDGKKLSLQVRKLIPLAYMNEIVDLGHRINRTLGAYIRGQLLVFVLMSLVTWIAIGPILHLRYAVVLSLATGVLEWFPIIGPIAAGAIAVTVGLFQPNVFDWNPWVFCGVIALVYTVLRYLEDYLVIPNVIGRAVHLHPLIVIFALFSGGSIAGILGMMTAVPVAAVIKLVLEYIYSKLTT
ncbi:MAG: AI-2E family transporter [Dehalococcoidia bacterium]|nr:AI-2E family transporter [Dehalococcoidia bacterium]